MQAVELSAKKKKECRRKTRTLQDVIKLNEWITRQLIMGNITESLAKSLWYGSSVQINALKTLFGQGDLRNEVDDLQGQLETLESQVSRKRKAISLDDFRKKFPLPDEFDSEGNIVDDFDLGRNPVGGFDPETIDDPFDLAKKNAELSKAIPISIVGGKGF